MTTKLSTSEIAELAGVSPSAVSQWLGKGTKTIHSIGQIEAAIKLERATGFSALWLAKGKGVKVVEREAPAPMEFASALRMLAGAIAKAPAGSIALATAELYLTQLARNPNQVDEIAEAFVKLFPELASSPTDIGSKSAAAFQQTLEPILPNGDNLQTPKEGTRDAGPDHGPR